MFFVVLIWALAELFVIVKVAEWIGFFWMLVLLAASWPVGWRVMRREGRSALAKLSSAVRAGRTPTREVIDGVLVLGGGVLLMVPGFLGDLVGVLLLIAPVRRRAGALVEHNQRIAWLHRFASWAASLATAFAGGGLGRRPSQSYDAESTAFDIDEKRLKQ